ncbi:MULTISPECIES: DegT/DnrJ/EryC1/StrS family aminotransferase [unclassified Thalassospira]|uniref:DegT/DnrJ/EryC1/StrS family aminotransferase n=1 Tax=unclassified Thalassospira TaxID=2648997 RepID=UPI001B1E3868|nr:DegT/DnrJ/EryC1/StrS family aminotransferase [Thalassospira sp.]MBO6769752.1 DegT/DnrJ/EryC1/StrS family aminotransferase [Thalassospira sp.]
MIPLIKPDINFSEVASDIKDVLESGMLTSGKFVREFEEKFAEYIGVKYALTTTSATTALHMSLVARGISVGDEVLVSDFTFPASGNAIAQCGATPVLVDCIPGRFDLDLDDARRKVSAKTKAIMVVHPFGQPVSSVELNAFSLETGLWVLEDAACAVTATSNGTRCGAIGGAGCFSFHPRKILTTGEGGMITTDNDELFEKLMVLRSHGGQKLDVGFEFIEHGFNYRMSELQAVLGIAQLQKIQEIVAERKRISKIYMDMLAPMSAVSIPLSDDESACSFQSFVILLEQSIDRNAVIDRMRQMGIETMLGTYAMHAQPAFSKFGYRPGDLSESYFAQNQSLTLPLVKGMTEVDVEFVVSGLQSAIS